MKIRQVREFFWPLLEGEPHKMPVDLTEADLSVSDGQLKSIYDLAVKNFDAEEKRNTTIETKSALFIGTLSVIMTVVLAVTTVLIKSDPLDIYSLLLLFILVLLSIYLCRTIWFSLRALERKNFHSLSYKDLLSNSDENRMYRFIILKVINNTRRNSVTINQKVDYMVMAQEYFKRCIFCVALYSIGLFLKCYDITSDKYHFSIGEFVEQHHFRNWLILCSVSLNVVLIFYFFLKRTFKKK